jgi:hypothetical protein
MNLKIKKDKINILKLLLIDEKYFLFSKNKKSTKVLSIIKR